MQSAPQCYEYYINQDLGNGNPRVMRPTLYSFARECSVINATNIPQGAIIQPLVDLSPYEQAIPIIDCSQSTIFRCQRCKGYINPNFTFIENGNSVICNLCKMVNKVTNEYFTPLNNSNQRVDKNERPELNKGIYEFITPKEYQQKEIKNIFIIICLEMTYETVQSGIFGQALNSINAILDNMRNQEITFLTICTYDQKLNFYNIPNDLCNDPQLIIVGDLQEPFCPLPRQSLFLNIQSDREKLNYLIEKLIKNGVKIIQDQQKCNQISASIGAVLQSAFCLIQPCCGRIIAFTSQIPQLGFGILKKRNEANNDYEKSQYQPQNETYKKIAESCLENSICVDLFVFATDYFDLSTISIVCSLTGGSLYYYPNYNDLHDGEKIHYELFRNLTRNYAYNVIMTLRTSPGIILQEYYTGAGKIQSRDLKLSALDADKSLAIIYKQEDNIQESQAYLQFAMLYTNIQGKRIIRIINQQLQVTEQISNLYKTVDIDAMTNIIIRKNIHSLNNQNIQTIKDNILQTAINILYSYRINCAINSSRGQLILPETIKLLPLYIQSLFKLDILKQGPQIKPDNRINEQFKLSTQLLYNIQHILYPQLYDISYSNKFSDVRINNNQLEYIQFHLKFGNFIQNEDRVMMPPTIPLAQQNLTNDGIYLFDNSEVIYIYLKQGVNTQNLIQLFGCSNIKQNTQFTTIESSPYNQKVMNIIDQLRRNKNASYQSIRILVEKYNNISSILFKKQQQREPDDILLIRQLMEDNIKSQETYSDFLITIHKKIQEKCN